MPTMYPDSLPKPLEEYLRGEAKVFEAFKNQLSKDWIVYHGVNWHIPSDRSNKQRDAETDFILTHPHYGIIVIEVKGGVQIRYVPEHNQWFSTSYDLDVHEINDPYYQAKLNKYNVINELLKISEFSHYDKASLDNKINIGYAAVFPDVTMVNGLLPVEAASEITFTSNHLSSIEKHIIELCNYYNSGKSSNETLTYQAHLLLKNHLAPSFTIDRTLTTWFEDEEKRIIELTDEQYNLLNYIRLVKKASIYGCAGSGKTLIAIRKAELLSLENQNVLLVCFNTILGKHLEHHFSRNEYVVAGSFYPIMSGELGIPLPYDNDDFIKQKVSEVDPGLFDAILIDEAQDFSTSQLEILKMMLKEDGLLYYFWDDNQQVMKRAINVVFDKDVFPIVLSTNLRNTAKIFESVKQHFHKEIELTHKGVEGRNVETLEPYKHKNASALFVRLKEVLFRLIEVEKLSPKDIVILTFKSTKKSHLTDFKCDYPLFIFSDDPKPDGVRIETVRRFKGMESKVVIVTEMDDESCIKNPELFEDMYYVSFSRAIHLLIILPPDSVDQSIVGSNSRLN
jgi:hypothetical protein